MPPESSEGQTGTAPAFDRVLNVRATNCPLPILKTRAGFAKMHCGEVLKVIYRQEQYAKELEMFSRQTGKQPVHTEQEGEHRASWLGKV
jgi:TusA-related sulfurtransferase